MSRADRIDHVIMLDAWVSYWLLGGVSPAEAVTLAKAAVLDARGHFVAPVLVESGWRCYRIRTNLWSKGGNLLILVRRRDGEVLEMGCNTHNG
ncbi:MAG TPA: hypothetical protein VFB66_29800 [Tepidisphaeraceae bacterium]|nr:hypothetical protein [Tepidisphaeraceae bacterium]